jgi:tetratricopeptide (TPR) repeat protein
LQNCSENSAGRRILRTRSRFTAENTIISRLTALSTRPRISVERAGPQEPNPRHLGLAEEAASYYEYRERWAVLVGISKYAYDAWSLKHAHRDAEKLAELLKQATYGGFDEKRILLLLDEQATTAALTKALRSFLKKPARQDLVLLHFSCHGAPDPDGLDEVYLVTHDTDPSDIAATALPMREVRYALDYTLKAQRVVILADTCHSAALGNRGRRSATPNAALMNSYLKQVGESKEGRAWLLSAEANEVSLEDERWGGGHGLFTHHLIEGLKGDADRDRRGVVKVGDLFDYVEQRVKEDSGHKQHPSKGVEGFDREMVLAVTAHLEAEEHYQIGRLLEEMGRFLDLPRLFESASRQLGRAFKLAQENGVEMPRAAIQNGLARLSAEEGERALDWFASAVESAAKSDPPDPDAAADARLYKVLALLDSKTRHLGEALSALDEFLAKHPEDSGAACAREVLERIERADRSRRRALLIGIAEYQSGILNLWGPVNDLALMRGLLTDHLGFLPEDVSILKDRDATKVAVLKALEELASVSGDEDVVVIYFAGHARTGDCDPYWVVHDTPSDDLDQAIKGSEIHSRLASIYSARTIAILDTHANEAFLQRFEDDPSYSLFLAVSPHQHALEVQAESEGAARTHGLFTWCLAQALRQGKPTDLIPRGIKGKVTEELRRLGYRTESLNESDEAERGGKDLSMSSQEQTPLFFGDEDQPLFRGLLDFPELFRFSRRRSFVSLGLERIQDLERRTARWAHPFPGFRVALGRAYLDIQRPDDAIRVLQAANTPASAQGRDGITRACAFLAAGREADARRAWEQAAGTRPEPASELERQALVDLTALVSTAKRRHALLVGINAYLAAEVPNPRGAVADVDALAAVLTERWGFRPEDITILTDAAATHDQILTEFRKLVGKARDEPCLFAFSGVGSVDAEGKVSIVAVDSRQLPEVFDDINLLELSQIAGDTCDHLITIVSAGWTGFLTSFGDDEEDRSRGRFAQEQRFRIHSRDLALPNVPRSVEKYGPRIGRLNFYDASLRQETAGQAEEVEAEQRDPSPGSQQSRILSRLFHALIGALWRLDPGKATGQDVYDAASKEWIGPDTKQPGKLPVIIPMEGLGPPLFDLPASRSVEYLRRLERSSIAELIPRLKRLVEKQGRPEHYLDLGIAQDVLGCSVDAIASLEEATNHEEATPGLEAEARYHLGRILYESGSDANLDRAIGELRGALELDPKLACAYYYLGRALRDSARRNMLDLSIAAFRAYLDAGAPLGHRDEVRRWMVSGPVATADPVASPASSQEGPSR